MSENRMNQKLSQLEQSENNSNPENVARLANSVSATYTTRQMLSVLGSHSPIIVPMDFTLDTYEDTIQQAEDFVLPFIEDGTIYTHPVYLLYRWKEDYVTEGAPVFEWLIYKTKAMKVGGGYGLYFNTSIAPIHKNEQDFPFERQSFCILINVKRRTVRVEVTVYQDEDPKPVLYLYENSDGLISVGDRHYNTALWNEVYTELEKGKYPALFLRTPDSGQYCPVTYEIAKDGAPDFVYKGSMQISYFKEINGKPELWVETRNFEDFVGIGTKYETVITKKYSLTESVEG